MPIDCFDYLRKLSGKERTRDANQHLGVVLAFVAGAINAGGFLAVQRYTSHMTGILSETADSLVLGSHEVALAGLGALICFLAGAACATIMVHYARRHQLHGEYALPLLLEAVLLLCFGMLGGQLSTIDGLFVSATVMLLSFLMGLQNALITKLSKAEIRTTHVTGIITDIGIELGKLVYWNATPTGHAQKVVADRAHLRVLLLLLLAFFVGSVMGALGFKYLGYIATIPLALTLVILACMPVIDDLQIMWGQPKSKIP
jgi:uncharacterized membrane protein YoaK (UPF0700 family)